MEILRNGLVKQNVPMRSAVKLAHGVPQVLEAVKAAESELGPIDLAVANAGVAIMGVQASLLYPAI